MLSVQEKELMTNRMEPCRQFVAESQVRRRLGRAVVLWPSLAEVETKPILTFSYMMIHGIQ